MPAKTSHLFFIFSLFIVFSCTQEPAPKATTARDAEDNKERIKKQFITANQQLMQKENDEMDYYARSHKMNFTRTGSGIRYYVYKPSLKGDSIRDSTEITMDFTVKLLDGTICYSSKTEGKKTFRVGQTEIESGIHKGVQYLKRGDQALLLIPSPLAHGLLGDFKKIPPQVPIIYDVKIE